MRPLNLVCISRDGLLHSERRITSAHGMIFVGDRRAEEGHNPVAHKDQDRKSTRLNSSHLGISYAVFCLKKKTKKKTKMILPINGAMIFYPLMTSTHVLT